MSSRMSDLPEAAPFTPAELQSRVDELRWFHRIDLGNGIVTPGEDESPEKLAKLRLPDRLDGLSVLDIGAWDGFFSFEAERRGAARVVAIDPECWREPVWGPNGWGTPEPFTLAHRALNSRVETIDIDLLEISPESVGTFDVVFFLGVFYHLPNPWLYLSQAASVCNKLMVLETHADMLDFPRAAMAFYPGAEVDGDESNYWGPNAKALAGMLAQEGLTRTRAYQESRAYRIARAANSRLHGGHYRVQQGRLVVHAQREHGAGATSPGT